MLGKPTPQVIPDVVPQVAPEVLELLHQLSGNGEMTCQLSMDVVGLKDREHFADAYLQPELDAGMLEMTIPDKPQSSKRRYRFGRPGGGPAGSMSEAFAVGGCQWPPAPDRPGMFIVRS